MQAICTSTQTDEEKLPQISVRSSVKNIKPVETCNTFTSQASYVNGKQCAPIIAEVANNIFGQNWSCEKADSNEEFYDNILPSRKAVNSYIEDFTILSLKDLGKDLGQKVLKDKEEGGKNTLHFDDTVKKSGDLM